MALHMACIRVRSPIITMRFSLSPIATAIARSVVVFVVIALCISGQSVDGLRGAVKCPGTASCNCTTSVGGHYNEYVCRRRHGRDGLSRADKHYPVVVRMRKWEQIEIECKVTNDDYDDYYDSVSQWSVQDEWLSLLDGIECSLTFDKMTILNCPLPLTGETAAASASFKNDVLNVLGVNDITNLHLNYIANGKTVFGDFYFRGLRALKNLQLQHNGIAQLSPSTLGGLDGGKLQRLYLNDNELRTLSGDLFAPVSSSLSFLELGHNNLTTLDDDLFRHTPNLVYLNAYGNKLHAALLRRQLFSRLPKLKNLDLSGNHIELLSDDVFHDLPSLRDVNLNFNNIARLPPSIFGHCTSLERVRASYSIAVAAATNTTSLPAALFANLTSLAYVSMDSNNLTVLPDSMFYKASNITAIFLNRNKLVSLPAAIFEYTVKLEILDLSDNRLTSLNRILFRTVKNLKKLYLRNNRIVSITRDLFISLNLLEELNLRNNGLLLVEPDSFSALIKLKVVDLSHNRLNMRDDTDPTSSTSLLSNCRHIREIRLQNNSVTTIFNDWLFTDLHLEMLDLSYNEIDNVDGNYLLQNKPQLSINLSHNQIAFVNLTYLEMTAALQCIDSAPCYSVIGPEIFLQDNPIVCDCRAYDLARYYQHKLKLPSERWLRLRPSNLSCTQPAFLHKEFLSKVNLDELQCPWHKLLGAGNGDEPNSCPHDCRCSFRPLDQCLTINCSSSESGNQNHSNSNSSNAIITEMLLPHRLPWAPFVQDVELLLSNRHLTSVNNISALLASSNVTKLSLSSNELQNIDDLYIPPQLKVLELHNNCLSSMGRKMIEKLNRTTNLTRITFHNNPWLCNCDTQHLMNFLRAKYQQIEDLENVTCMENGKAISKLSVDELCPLSAMVIMICVSLATFGILFGATILLYYQFQYELRVWMFANKICLWLVTEKEIDRDKKYDAFVSYSHLDEPFVINHLMPTLEGGPNPFQLCLHFRDWVVGEWIPTQIIRSVEMSRRTIVVLSPNFLNSVWGQMEFRTAHLKAIKERCARVIIILLKDIGEPEKLDPELKAYLTMNTYVKWGDPWFWQKLKYALPHPSSLTLHHCCQQQGQASLTKTVPASIAKEIPS